MPTKTANYSGSIRLALSLCLHNKGLCTTRSAHSVRRVGGGGGGVVRIFVVQDQLNMMFGFVPCGKAVFLGYVNRRCNLLGHLCCEILPHSVFTLQPKHLPSASYCALCCRSARRCVPPPLQVPRGSRRSLRCYRHRPPRQPLQGMILVLRSTYCCVGFRIQVHVLRRSIKGEPYNIGPAIMNKND